MHGSSGPEWQSFASACWRTAVGCAAAPIALPCQLTELTAIGCGGRRRESARLGDRVERFLRERVAPGLSGSTHFYSAPVQCESIHDL